MNENDGSLSIALDLQRCWDDLLREKELPLEVSYRIRRLSDRLMPVLHKTYVKTEQGKRALAECRRKTDRLARHLHSGEERIYLFLTDLERFYEDFLRTAIVYSVNAVSHVAKLKSNPHGTTLILGDKRYGSSS